MRFVPSAINSGLACGVMAIRLFVVVFLWLWGQANADVPGFAFGVNGEDFSLSRYHLDDEGRLRHLGHIPIDKAPSSVVVDPSGRFVVAVSSTSDNLFVFYLNPVNGELAPVPGSPFATNTRSPFSVRFHPSGRFIYVGARFSGVGAFQFDQRTGTVQPIAGSPFPAQRRTRAISIHPSGKFLYASNAYSNSVSAYHIDESSGALSELLGSPYSVGDFGVIDYPSLKMGDVPPTAGGIPLSIDMDPEGRFVFVPNKAAASVSVFAINQQTGSLQLVKGSPFFVGFNPYRLRVHPSGHFVFVTLWSDAQMAVLSLDQDSGRLAPVEGSPFATEFAAPVEVTFNKDGSKAYVSNYDGNAITAFDVDVETGRLAMKEAIATRMGPWSLAIVDGHEVGKKNIDTSTFVAARGEAGFARFRAKQGVLQLVDSISHDGNIVAVEASPDGKFIFALDAEKEAIYSYVLDGETGHILSVPQGVVKTGKAPTDLLVDIQGWYLYVTNSGGRSMSAYFIDPNTGVLEPVRGSPVYAGLGPRKVVQDPAARFAFVVNGDSEDVSSYRHMNNVTPLIFEGRKYGSPFAVGDEPMDMLVDPTGRYAYVADAGSREIAAFHVQHKTGALSPIPGSPFKVAGKPIALAVPSHGQFLYAAHVEPNGVSIFSIEPRFGALAKGVKEVSLPVPPKSLHLDAQNKVLYVLADDGRRILSFSLQDKGAVLMPQGEGKFSRRILDLVRLPKNPN
jgi:6-phosphogluconolactonase (cycloisomerase 2 family)